MQDSRSPVVVTATDGRQGTRSIRGTTADPKSIMCYQLPGEITKDGKPIVGGLDIDASDYTFAATIYPKGKVAPKKKTAVKKK